ncbi:MAG: protein kinase domain-containing protein [Gemmatimonadaceae bacterium]
MSLLSQLQATLGDQYQIERELGGGGMSRVFLATESALGRSVVIKVVAPNLAEGFSADRFTREVKVAARLQQANIVPLLNAGDASGVAYYTMPFVDGLSLRARLTSGPLSLADATNVLRDVAKALSYAHAQSVVHRDIKPENVLLSGGTAMVTDFGIAKALTASRTHDDSEGFATASATLTSAGSSLGTPAYMAPEQAVGSVVDLRADLYAWGVMAYELLTGGHPFAGRTTAQQLIAAHIAETPAPITMKQPAIPAALASVVMRCLEKDPEQRPSSATELLAPLDSVGTSEPPSVVSARLPAPNGRRTRLVIGIAATLLAVAAGGWLLTRDQTAGSTNPVAAPSTGDDKSLAVIPFESAGGDTANAYFAEGIADELTTALARVPGLRLAGRNSAARFRGQGASAPEVGKALSVATVLAGSLRRAGDRVRVTAELTSAADGRVLWQDTFERRVEDVFAVQDEIASAIASALQVRLGNGGATPATALGTTDFEAYDLYLRGLQLYRNRRGPELREAERVLEQAIAKDPKFARPYATLASTLLVQPYYLDIRMGSILPRALAAAERAVALAPDLPEALASLGHVHTESFLWSQAETELRSAYDQAPNNSEIGFRLGFMYITSGRSSLAIPTLEQVRRIDPFYSMPSMYLAWSLGMAGRNSEAIAEARRALALDPTNEALNNVYANTLMAAGATSEAMAHARRLAEVTTNPRRLGFYAAVIGLGGGDVSAIARRIEAFPADGWGVNAAHAYLALALRDTARALRYMEKAAAGDGDLLLAQTLNSTLFSPLAGNPRFAKVLRRYNLDVAAIGSPQMGRPR